MIMNAILAVALGLTPVKDGVPVQTFHYRPSDFAGLIGHYRQQTDRRGTTHLRGFDRRSGRPFDIAIASDGRVEGNVGETYVVFTVSEAA